MNVLQARAGVSTVQPPLSQAVGYVVVVVIGVIIALGNYSLAQTLRVKLTSNSNDAHNQGFEENHRRR